MTEESRKAVRKSKRDTIGYRRARKRALKRMRNARYLKWSRPVSRDELHER